ncbi:MAG: hypothetical protein HOD63_17245 [Bacteroidetes bacterium]|jgi:hypothetical protein|nr:hypothetical protein [Bacteroidota bacterium]MBT5529275.1 hypothetical protein [Cytophagia bacterium]MBT3423788.1 hypothetical protein [Bacteroidota bacterium]MBT3800063.1 hypothetical protein [Bacteroidota bacterium]MBT3932708.1 hypothetical protein [Bacteroidota bacterium]
MKNYYKVIGLILILLSGMLFLSCEENKEDVSITYAVKGLSSDFNVTFLNEDEETIRIDSVLTDDWNYSFIGNKGDIVYIYVRYHEDASLSSNFYVGIEVNGKAYKYSNSFDKDWGTAGGKYRYQIIRSGTVPF